MPSPGTLTERFPVTSHHQDIRRMTAVAVGCIVFSIVLIRTAWLCDDAFITLRTIDNFVHGFGLRWNVGERVQAFTHPAWLILLTPFYALTREPYYTTLVLQIALSLGTFYLLCHTVAMRAATAVLTAAVAVSSKAWVDFSTSGLENPLTHFLLVLVFLTWRRTGNRGSRVATIVTLTSLVMLCRDDLIVLLLPLVAWELLGARPWPVRAVMVGLLPFAAWEVFSFIYYGALVPNTALAKLSTGIPAADLFHQGLHYWWATLLIDPVTPLVIVVSSTALAISFGARGRIMALGCLLYALYMLLIGGDFMSGRFLTPILLWGIAGLVGLESRTRVPDWVFVAAAVLTLGGGLLAPATPPLFSGARFGVKQPDGIVTYFGVTEERDFYYPSLGLLRKLDWGARAMPLSWEDLGRRLRQRGSPQVVQASNVGVFGYWAGPLVHVIDRNALADPLLARLPAKPGWRIGHFTRDVPAGYVQTWESGTNVLTDPDLHRFYDDLRLLTQSPIWSLGRFRMAALQAAGRITPARP